MRQQDGSAIPVSDRLAVPLLLVGAAAFALALARFAEHAAGPLFLTHMFDLGIYRDGGLIARHAYAFRAGHSRPLYDWVSPGGNPFTYTPFAAEVFAFLSFLPLNVLRWAMTASSLVAIVAAAWLALGSAGVPRGRTRAGVTLLASAAALCY
jgi:alpha-1,2-mannosyltransferase